LFLRAGGADGAINIASEKLHAKKGMFNPLQLFSGWGDSKCYQCLSASIRVHLRSPGHYIAAAD
jgi:hypothetical protein